MIWVGTFDFRFQMKVIGEAASKLLDDGRKLGRNPLVEFVVSWWGAMKGGAMRARDSQKVAANGD